MILTCSRCKVNKPCNEFHKSRGTKTGYSYFCTKCANIAGALLRQKPAYNSYDNVKKRCDIPSHDAYRWYGARGITYDPTTFQTYKAFWEEYGSIYEKALKDWPLDKLTIDRIDNDGDYIPGNIRFVPQYINENNRRDNYYITYHGVTQSAAMWSREWNIPAASIIKRHKAGWNIQLIIHTDTNTKLAQAITRQINSMRGDHD